jgi:hypothetical protein
MRELSCRRVGFGPARAQALVQAGQLAGLICCTVAARWACRSTGSLSSGVVQNGARRPLRAKVACPQADLATFDFQPKLGFCRLPYDDGMTVSTIVGPGWTSRESGRYSGRYPLAVERHALAQVARLLPGVTTVTPHARYYMLHGLVASEIERQGLGAADAQKLVRRCEVVLGAISTLHQDPHPGMSRAHGSDKIVPALASGAALETLVGWRMRVATRRPSGDSGAPTLRRSRCWD